MLVRMLATAAGPEYLYVRGRVYDVPTNLANVFLNGGLPDMHTGLPTRPAAEKVIGPFDRKLLSTPYIPKKGKSVEDGFEEGGDDE